MSGKQWTLLSGVVQVTDDSSPPKVVSLATGTKCIGAGKLCGKGTVVNDSHAEVSRQIKTTASTYIICIIYYILLYGIVTYIGVIRVEILGWL
jgi:hypothetical protein